MTSQTDALGPATTASRWHVGSLAVYGSAVVPVAVIFGRVMQRMIDAGDFPAHVRVAQRMVEGDGRLAPHFAFHALVAFVHSLVPGLSWPAATRYVAVAAVVLAAVVIAHWIVSAIPAHNAAGWMALAVVMPSALIFVNPLLPLGTLTRDPWLIGYFPANVLHSPTTIGSKPLVLLLFAVTARALAGATRGSHSAIAATAALVLLGALMKPSYLMALLPAAGLLALVGWKRTDWRVIVTLGVTTVVLLALQFAFYYQSNTEGVTIIFAPLMVIGLYSDTSSLTLVGKLLASIAFPLAVLLCFPRTWSDTRSRLAWLTFAIGSAYGYVLAEGGGQADNGNFLWSGQLAAFVLFAASVWLVVSAVHEEHSRARALSRATWMRIVACAILFAAHVVSGVRHLHSSWFA